MKHDHLVTPLYRVFDSEGTVEGRHPGGIDGAGVKPRCGAACGSRENPGDQAHGTSVTIKGLRAGTETPADVDRRKRPVQLSNLASGIAERSDKNFSGKNFHRRIMTSPLTFSNRRRIAFIGLVLPFILAGCEPTVANRGNMLDEERIAQVKVGTSSKNDVFEALGSPSTVSTFDDSTWYYIGQRTEREAVFAPVVTDRKVIVVKFDGSDHVATIDRVGLDQAVEVEALDETTPAAGRDLTFMEQILGNVGRYSSKKKKGGGQGN